MAARAVKLTALLIIMAVCFVLLTACSDVPSAEDTTWRRLVDSARGTTLNFYNWHTDSDAYEWFNGTIKKQLDSVYTINFVQSEATFEEVLEQLTDDKVNDNQTGGIDLLWVDEAQFSKLKSAGLLYGPFVDDIRNYASYFSKKDLGNTYIGSTAIAGYAVPFNQDLLTFYYDRDVIYDAPESLELLEQLVKEKPGMFTYPHPNDPVGAAFIRSVILHFSDPADFVGKDLSKDDLRQLATPGLTFLQSLKPHLYQEGMRYPASAKALDQLFAKGDVMVTMSMDYRHGDTMTGEAVFPTGTRPFIMLDSNVGARQYIVIPFNATNKSGAMAALNLMIGNDIQFGKLRSKAYRGLPSYTAKILDENVRGAMQNAVRKKSIIAIDDLLDTRVHDIPTRYHATIDELWQEMVGGQ